MKLSEAIRLGSMVSRQIFGELFGPDHGACAMGAAYLATGFPAVVISGLDASQIAALGFRLGEHVESHFPRLRGGPRFACPVDLHERGDRCFMKDSLTGTVVHLNDVHHWTRERIADWVETVGEPAVAEWWQLFDHTLRQPVGNAPHEEPVLA